MAEQKEVAKQTIKVKNTGKADNVLHDADGGAKTIGPGQEAELEVAEPQAKILQEASKKASPKRRSHPRLRPQPRKSRNRAMHWRRKKPRT
jgi:hypothetical protein